MKACYRNRWMAACVMLFYMPVCAQVKIENVPDAPGKLKRNSNVRQFISNFKVLPAAKATSLTRTTNAVIDVICRLPQVNAPIGYNTHVNVSVVDQGMKEREPLLNVFCYLRNLTRDSRYTGIKESMDGADLYFKINAFNFFNQFGNFWQDCNKAKVPLFFEAPLITDSTGDYLEIRRDGTPVRFVCTGKKPLLVPLTRREYVQFLIAREKSYIADDEKSIGELENNQREAKTTLAHPPSYLTADTRKALAEGVKTQEQQEYQFQDRVKKGQEKLRRCQEYLEGLPPAEAAAPARLDKNRKSDEFGGIEQLVPAGHKEGVLLTKINPDYYEHTAGSPTAQMLLIYYAWPTTGFETDPNYVQQAALDIFKSLDYHALKQSLQ